MAKIIIKHSDDIKQSDVTSHNTANEKLVEKWKKFGNNIVFEPKTLEDFKNKPGFYYKDRGELRGPFDSMEDAADVKGELDFERKHG